MDKKKSDISKICDSEIYANEIASSLSGLY